MVDYSAIRTEADPNELAPVIDANLRFEPPTTELEPGDMCRGYARLPFCVSERSPDVDDELLEAEQLDLVRPELATYEEWDDPELRRFRLGFSYDIDEGTNPESITADAQNLAEDLLVYQIDQILEAGVYEQPIYGFRSNKRFESGSSDSLSPQTDRMEVGTATWTVEAVYVQPFEGLAPSIDEPSEGSDDD